MTNYFEETQSEIITSLTLFLQNNDFIEFLAIIFGVFLIIFSIGFIRIVLRNIMEMMNK